MPRTHKTLKRLFVESPLVADSEVVLGRDPSSYLINVLRKRAGDEIILFNGKDGAWRVTIEVPGKKAVTLRLAEQIAAQTPPADLWYGFAPLKTGRLDYMIQKATEMGVGMIQPVFTRHTQVNRIKIERITANAIEAAEQCEVLCVPRICEETSLERLITDWPDEHADRVLILADEGEASASPQDRLAEFKDRPLGLLIGPEGGFSEEERALLHKQSFVVPVSLGPRILRADTAAVAALAVIQSTIGDWR